MFDSIMTEGLITAVERDRVMVSKSDEQEIARVSASRITGIYLND